MTGYVKCPALILDAGDFVKVRGTWYKLVQCSESTPRHKRWTLIDRNGGRLHWNASIGNIETAYRIARD